MASKTYVWKVWYHYGTSPSQRIFIPDYESTQSTKEGVLAELAAWLNDEELAPFQLVGDLLINRSAVMFVTVALGQTYHYAGR